MNPVSKGFHSFFAISNSIICIANHFCTIKKMHYLHHKVSSHIFQAFDFTLDEAGKTAKDVLKPPVNSKKERRRKREVFYPHFDSNDDQVFSSYAIYRRRRKLNEALGENPLLLSIFQHENVCVHYTHVNQVMQCKKIQA